MTRWKVRKERGMFWDEHAGLRYGPRWHVISPTGASSATSTSTALSKK